MRIDGAGEKWNSSGGFGVAAGKGVATDFRGGRGGVRAKVRGPGADGKPLETRMSD